MSRERASPFLVRLERRMFVFSGAALMLAGCVFLFSAAGGSFGQEQEPLCPTGLGGSDAVAGASHEKGKLAFETASGRHEFAVEIMRTLCELRQGLMFRPSLAADRGMVFEFPREQILSMWMKNTYIPLDMIFVANGKVVFVAEDAVPLSERVVFSPSPASRVIEVNAGTAARIGLRAGDRVELGPAAGRGE
jgi:uncharacterized protein